MRQAVPELFKRWSKPLQLAFGWLEVDDLLQAMRPVIEHARAAEAVGVIREMMPALEISTPMAEARACGLTITYRLPGDEGTAPIRRWRVPDFILDTRHDETDRTPPWAPEEEPAAGG